MQKYRVTFELASQETISRIRDCLRLYLPTMAYPARENSIHVVRVNTPRRKEKGDGTQYYKIGGVSHEVGSDT